MLLQLHISNYALIDTIDIDFTSGLVIITGETGAGKSIMLGALSLLLGARADSRAVTRTDVKSVVEARFSVEGNASLKQYCTEADVEWDDSEIILRREILPSGRSRAFINDSPVTVSVLEEVGRHLVDIHSQNQNALLATPEFQRRIIDALADNGALLSRYADLYSALRKAEQRLESTRRQIEQNRQDEEFTRFRLAQLTDASLQPGEQEELEKERDILANMTDIKENLTEALGLLTENSANVLGSLADAVELCENLADVLDDASSLANRLESARVEIQDITETLADYDANLQADPSELEEVEQRLDRLYGLQSRFKVDSVEKLIAMRDELSQRLSMLEDSSVTLADLKAEADAARKQAVKVAGELTTRRKRAADEFAAILLETARPLGMANLRVEADVLPDELGPNGADRVEFRFAFNKNQTPVAVGGTASGGEVSRLMLSIKSIAAGKLLLPTIIFDEVDTGVSGDVANRMGQMMRTIAADRQVIAITHLPQVAAKGACHFKVYKEDDDVATHTRIRRLTDTERRSELAVMLSGSATDATALATADSLLTRQ